MNPYAVKQKKLDDNSREKNEHKDPKLITNLVKNGSYGIFFLLEGFYVDIRRQNRFRE